MTNLPFSLTQEEFLRAREQDDRVTPPALALLQSCCALYEQSGLLPDGRDAPLNVVCPNGRSCWGSESPRSPDRAGVSAPWIGTRYPDRRICVIGMNFDDWGGLPAHWEVTSWHVEAMRRGLPGKDGRFFAAGAMSYVAAIEASRDGELDSAWEPPTYEELAAYWAACVFLQTVKCSPCGNRSQPFEPMYSNCPSLLLRDELEILDPEVVVLLGRGSGPRDAVRPLLNVSWGTHPRHLERDTFKLSDGRERTLFSCNHPSGQDRNDWRASLAQLIESLIEEPV